MRLKGWSLLLTLTCGEALAQACIVHSQAERLDVKVCQQNRNIPEKLFADGFCQPNLAGQTVEVQYLDCLPCRGVRRLQQCSSRQYALPAGYSLLRRGHRRGVFEAVLRGPEPRHLAQTLSR